MVRLQKFLADAGIASRRACEKIILAGRVQVNGRAARVLGTRIDPDEDRVGVDGRPVKPKKKLYLALNKPREYLCTRFDPQSRPTIAKLLPLEWSHLYPVGRLDFDSEGLLLLTNDGEFCLKLAHPRYGITKKYRVTVTGRVEQDMARHLTHGAFEGGEILKALRARILSSHPSSSLVEIELAEGKKREIRRLFQALGLTVTRLQRVQIGRIKLGELRLGRWRTLTESEIKSLLSEV